ncbi:hypothetical protein [Buchananella hordeovulneris]|uniref:hypothetical protein n=1 Tax=Buchananella hordeovulneris TaxID=52770 RepID=UPI0026DBEA5C|nr:hypothetical protein [Buchananella hordeovulneris]MDO5080126.1 hypothetical protein [Buchananella hordeovulneris]
MSSVTLHAYAILSSNFDSGGSDFRGLFLEFPRAVVARNSPKAMRYQEVAARVKKSFGVEIPSTVVRDMLKRLVRDGKIQRLDDENFFCSQKQARGAVAIDEKIDHFSADYDRLVIALRRFCSEEAQDLLEVIPSIETCSEMLVDYLDRHAIVVSGRRAYEADVRLKSSADYVVHQFVGRLYRDREPLLDVLAETAKGAIISALLRMNVSSLASSLSELTVFLDTALVLAYMGFRGSEKRADILEIVDIAKGLGVKFEVFSHTLGEVKSILLRVGECIKGEGYDRGDVYKHCVNEGVRPTELFLAANKLSGYLSESGIRERTAGPIIYSDSLDVEDLRVRLQDYYRSEAALQHDVDSVVSVSRLRGTRFPEKLERSHYLFLTENLLLSRHSHGVYVNSWKRPGDRRKVIDLAMLDEVFATQLWLRSPAASSELAKSRLVATAWAGLMPDDEVWQSWLAAAENLCEEGSISDEDLLLLRTEYSMPERVLRAAGGDSGKVSRVAVKQVLERYKDEISDEAADKERRKYENALAEGKAGVEEEISGLRSELEAISRCNDDLGADIDRYSARLKAGERRIEGLARNISRGIAVVVGLLLAVSIWLLSSNVALKLGSPVGIFLLEFFGIKSARFSKVRVGLEERVSSALKRWFFKE